MPKKLSFTKKRRLAFILVMLILATSGLLYIISDNSKHGFSNKDTSKKTTKSPRSKNSSDDSPSTNQTKNKDTNKPQSPLSLSQNRRLEYVKNLINQAKDSGEINQSQADALNKKADELKNFRLELSKMDKNARHAKRTEKTKEIDNWLKENKIQQNYLRRII